MKIKFLKDCYIEVCVGFDDEDEPMMVEEKIVEGEIFKVEEIESSIETEFTQVQFENDYVAVIDKQLIEIIYDSNTIETPRSKD